MKKVKAHRRATHRTLPLIFIGLAVMFVVLISFASCGEPNVDKDTDSAIVKRTYSVCPVLWGDVISVDVNEAGQIVSFGAFYIDLMPQDNLQHRYSFTFTYDESGKIVGGKSVFGQLTNIKYDDEGRIVSANFTSEGKVNERLLFVTYNEDGGTTWSFPTKKDHILGTKYNIPTIVFDKDWYCVGGRTSLWKMEVTAADNTRNVKIEDGQEWIATYDDYGNLLSLTSKDDKWEYELDEKGNCLSSKSNKASAICEYDKYSAPTSTVFYENGVIVKKITNKYDDLHRHIQFIIEEFDSEFGSSKSDNNYEYYGNGNQMKCHIRYFIKNGVLINNEVFNYHENGKSSGGTVTTFTSKGYMEMHSTSTCDEKGNPIQSESQFFYENGQVKSREVRVYDDANKYSLETFEYDEKGNLTDHKKKDVELGLIN